jgi:hypothetical protein
LTSSALPAMLDVRRVTMRGTHTCAPGRAGRQTSGSGKFSRKISWPGLSTRIQASVGCCLSANTDRPVGATILLSHSPLQADKVAAAGVGLMLSGHTHNGQIWPFNHLVALRYPLMGGRYQVEGMTVVVSRGAGTWGPRMRLWRPSEIVRIKLKAMSVVKA